MDISPISSVQNVLNLDAQQAGQEASLLVLKKALAMQESGVTDLLEAIPTNLPLATSGSLGTQLNLLV
jgi:hypothetical protein